MGKVIAEFCQNHNGDKHILRDMIWGAAQAGADYAKIQTIFAGELTRRERFETGIVENGETRAIRRPFEAEYQRLKRLEILFDDYDWYLSECESAGIEPMTTVFTRAQIPKVASFGFAEVKVASYDCGSAQLLRELRPHFGRVVVSTGATFDEEIATAAQILSGMDLTLLHCVTIYPTPLDELHLARMEFLKRFGPSVGFSDHTARASGVTASAVALHLGASVIERHFSILGPDASKDGSISIDPKGLEQLTRLAHATPSDVASFVHDEIGDFSHMLGDANRELTAPELLNRDYYRGRFASQTPEGPIYNWEETPIPAR